MAWKRSCGLLEDTIIAMVADHGTDLGDHGLLQKQSFYEQTATVPYLLLCSGIGRQGIRVTTPVNAISLLPTVMRLAGIPCPPVEGATILPGKSPGGPVCGEIEYGYQRYRDDQRQVMIREGQLKMPLFNQRDNPEAYASDPDGGLCDLESDPLERTNLFARPVSARVFSRLKSRVVDWDRSRRFAGTRQ
jgi:arylsulfatase A-like enzyme